jgi:hypothetical protein
MLDLKGALDMLMAADAAVKTKAAEIAALLSQGTEEATQQALALQGSLDELQAGYAAKKNLYDTLVKAASPDNDVAKLFVPVSPTSSDNANEAKPKGVMKRSDWETQSPSARQEFLRTGGKLQD